MKGIFSIFILSLLFTMGWGDHDNHDRDNDDYQEFKQYILDQYCTMFKIDCFDFCLDVILGEENSKSFKECLMKITGKETPHDIQKYLCQIATEEELQTFDECIHEDEEKSVAYYDGFDFCLIYQELGLYLPELFCSCSSS
ncbi:uncharacterized protein [Centruroides vittatus]|uniref:uncharacterized protein n=1 Tax=Centruroides vittatus TaxID=120091 RepID=UPI00350EB374